MIQRKNKRSFLRERLQQLHGVALIYISIYISECIADSLRYMSAASCAYYKDAIQ